MITSRLALLRHLWAMLQTRGEAAGLVLRLQRDALGRGLAWSVVAAMAAMAFLVALLLLVAVGTPEEYRVAALAGLALALLISAITCANRARRQLARDTGLIADFATGLRLDLAMVNLALKDPEADDDVAIAEREQARTAVRGAVADRAAKLEPSELDLPLPSVTAPEAMTRPRTEEHAQHGRP